MTDTSMPGHPVGPEEDDSQNPTAGAPDSARAAQMRDMLAQLQTMIDSVAVRSGPVLREVAAKAAELAAVAGERAGPLAYKAAETTQNLGRRVAERGKEVAADLRRPQADAAAEMGENGEASSTPADAGADEASRE